MPVNFTGSGGAGPSGTFPNTITGPTVGDTANGTEISDMGALLAQRSTYLINRAISDVQSVSPAVIDPDDSDITSGYLWDQAPIEITGDTWQTTTISRTFTNFVEDNQTLVLANLTVAGNAAKVMFRFKHEESGDVSYPVGVTLTGARALAGAHYRAPHVNVALHWSFTNSYTGTNTIRIETLNESNDTTQISTAAGLMTVMAHGIVTVP